MVNPIFLHQQKVSNLSTAFEVLYSIYDLMYREAKVLGVNHCQQVYLQGFFNFSLGTN